MLRTEDDSLNLANFNNIPRIERDDRLASLQRRIGRQSRDFVKRWWLFCVHGLQYVRALSEQTRLRWWKGGGNAFMVWVNSSMIRSKVEVLFTNGLPIAIRWFPFCGPHRSHCASTISVWMSIERLGVAPVNAGSKRNRAR